MEAKQEEKETEETSTGILEADITGITFGLASRDEIHKASINECPITHASQLSNPYLGLPLEFGRCESCGTSDLGQCEGHFGYIELPIPIYHPAHVSELKKMLSLLCLKCLKIRDSKFPVKAGGLGERLLGACCEDAAQVSVREIKKSDGACTLQLRILSKSRYHEGFWSFLERYGFRYGDSHLRSLLPCEVQKILKKMPKETKKKLTAKGYFPQDGYILEFLPVPPNCLSVPDVSDGVSVMSSDLSISMLRKVLKQVEIIRSSRSGNPNFESHEVEANDLQTVVQQYLEVRGTAKAARDVDSRYGVRKESSDSATKAWLEKMRTLFIRKGSGFSSRSVITGDAFKKVNEIGIPYEIAQRITFEERVSNHNIRYLQELVDKKLCLTYKDGASIYSLREGSKGHTFLKPGQVVHRRIMDGDTVFINRPPTTHKHSLQALSVYVHEDHTVKINPLICGPLGADFDGDCIHLFYPQSLAAKAEVLELFAVEKQLLSSHSGNLNLQLATDALLSLKLMFKKFFFDKPSAQQLAMFVTSELPRPAILKADRVGAKWSVVQMLQTALPAGFDCASDKYLIRKGDILSVNFGRDLTPSLIPSMLPSMLNDIVTYIIFKRGPIEVLDFFNSLQPLLMENIFAEGYSISLEDFYAPKSAIRDIQENISYISPLLYYLRSSHNDLVQRQLDRNVRLTKDLLLPFILDFSAFGGLIDPKSESAITKVVQQIGFLGLQLSNKGKFYSESLFEEMAALFESKYPFNMDEKPAGQYGMIRGSFISGLDPYEVMAHSISTREVIVRSTRGLSEPGTLFKNLMAILRDVVICYDGTVRNVCSNSLIQFEYGAGPGSKPETLFPPGEPVGVLAATAMSNPAYKAVLDSSPNSNSSWEQMKEILLSRVNFRNDPINCRIILYLNECTCGRNHCRENAACVVKNHLRKISLKDAAVDFMVEYRDQRTVPEGSGMHTGLIGHIHLNEVMLREQNISMLDVQQKCQETLLKFRKKKKLGNLFKKIVISVSEGCYFHHLRPAKKSETPCLSFSLLDWSEVYLEKSAHILANMICPVLLETIIKGDPRIASANITWITPDTTSSRMKNPSQEDKGELAVDVTLEKSACKRSGDAWRIVFDCCLPILHLIDTTRSVPYAVKQIEELLGISCTFDQAVQRLSTSVTSVAKGILKEHLVLLADTMTCAGTLIGFNSAGYKALSKALGIQVPFTEATLFTPRKCFERASEKSHTDTLSSVVASCSWGKPVAVGTGSKFDLLWGTEEVELKLEEETDVYSFLHMVRGTKVASRLDSGCLGAEVDSLNEREGEDHCLSPENDGISEKPSFEDSELFKDDVQDKPGQSSWDNAGTKQAKGDSWSSWDKPNSSKKVDDDESGAGENSAWVKNTSKPETGPSGWGSDKKDNDASEQGWKNTSSWAKESRKRENTAWDAAASERNGKDDVASAEPSGWSSWRKDKVQADDTNSVEGQGKAWGKSEAQDGGSNGQGWGKKSEGGSQSSRGWKKKGDDYSTKAGWDDAEAEIVGEQGKSWRSAKEAQDSGKSGYPDGGWGNKKDKDSFPKPDDSNNQGWGKKSELGSQSSKDWNRKGDDYSTGAGRKDMGWDKKPEEESPTPIEWSKKDDVSTPKDGEWSTPGWGKKTAERSQTSAEWSKKDDVSTPKDGNWNTGKKPAEGSQSPAAWSKKDDVSTPKDGDWNTSGYVKKSTEGGQTPTEWSKKDDAPIPKDDNWNTSGRGKKPEEESPTPTDWPKTDDGSTPKAVGRGSSAWDKKPEKASQSPGEWNKKDDDWANKKSDNATQSWKEWGPKKDDDGSTPKDDGLNNSSGCGKKVEEGDLAAKGWGSSPGADENKGQNNPWVSKEWRKNQDGSNRRGPNPEWKIKKNRPPRPPEMSPRDPNAPRLFTETRQRLDMFTSEEQPILSDVEPIMQSIRRIMRLPGYTDSDPLPAEDQSCIVDNVLNHHPDKASKIGSGVDHIMVSKHSSFQDTRCFYVASTDGRKEDFSYRKCLENYVKGKYPELAEEFIGKYFVRRDRDRTAKSRERSASIPPEDIGTPDNS